MKYVVLLLTTALAISLPTFSSTLDIDINQTRQTIHSFGAYDTWSIQPTITKWYSNEDEAAISDLSDLLFSKTHGIGLSAWWFNIGAGSAEQGEDSLIPDPWRRAELLIPTFGGKVDKRKQRGQIIFMQHAYQIHDVNNLIAFTNSPPHYLTQNGLTFPQALDRFSFSNLPAKNVDHFSEFLVSVLQYLRSDEVGLPVNYISPINEPAGSADLGIQEGNLYNTDEKKSIYHSLNKKLTAVQLSDMIHIVGGQSIEYKTVSSDSLKMEVDESIYYDDMKTRESGLCNHHIDELFGDEEIKQILGNNILLHGNFRENTRDPLGKLCDLTYENVQAVSPHATIWMSEGNSVNNDRYFNCQGFDVNDISYALHIGQMMHRDLTRLNASAWHWGLGLTPYDCKKGLVTVGPSLESETVQSSKLLWTIGNYSRFVRPGYKRVELDGYDDLDGLMASAYLEPQGHELVVVVVNASENSDSIAIQLDDIELKKTDAFVTSKDHDLSKVNLDQERGEFILPPVSIVTFVASIK